MSTTGLTTFNPNLNDAYLCGVFDGEGCVSMHLAKANYISIIVKVTMCDRQPVEDFYKRFGGSFEDGRIKTKSGRSIYSWTIYNSESVEALEVFSKGCRVKNIVAKHALPIAFQMNENEHRGILTQEQKHARVEAAKLITKINKPVGARRIFDHELVAEYMRPKIRGGGKMVKLSDGREFKTLMEAAKELGVTNSAISVAIKKKTKTRGLTVEFI